MFKAKRKDHIATTFLSIAIGASLLTGCGTTPNLNIPWPGKQPSYPQPNYPQPSYPQNNNGSAQITYNERGVPSYYKVRQGDTVANIASHYGINYRQIADLNGLDSSYTIYTGQMLKLWANRNSGNTGYPPINNSNNVNNGNNNGNYNVPNKGLNTSYQLPTGNQIIQNFNSSTGSNGMWFRGVEGDPVLASLGGTVLYSGSGLPEYGNLIMIRHDDNYVTAYAHNKDLLVREGDMVRTGQRIATMGRTGNTNQVALEFQLRRNGAPIDPMTVLNRPRQ